MYQCFISLHPVVLGNIKKIKLIAFDIIRLHLKNSVRRYRFIVLNVAFGHAFDSEFDINILFYGLRFYEI